MKAVIEGDRELVFAEKHVKEIYYKYETIHCDTKYTPPVNSIHLEERVKTWLRGSEICEKKVIPSSLFYIALDTLRSRFGREEYIVHPTLKNVFLLPALYSVDPFGLEKFHATIDCTVSILETLGYSVDLRT